MKQVNIKHDILCTHSILYESYSITTRRQFYVRPMPKPKPKAIITIRPNTNFAIFHFNADIVELQNLLSRTIFSIHPVSPVLLLCGTGMSGIGFSRNLHNGSHPSFTFHINSRSAGTLSFTVSLCFR